MGQNLILTHVNEKKRVFELVIQDFPGFKSEKATW